MEKSISINRKQLPIKEYKGQRVVTFKDIDMVHGRPDGTARKRFNENKKRFIEGVDYFNVQTSEKRTLEFDVPNRGLTLITESGYLMLAKSFTDDLAWTVQRELVNNYFRVSKGITKRDVPTTRGVQLTLETAEYHYFDKTYKGEPVITLDDFEHFTGVPRSSCYFYMKRLCRQGEDHHTLSGKDVYSYKQENPSVNKLMRAIVLLKASAVRKLLDYFKKSVDVPILRIEEKRSVAPVKAERESVNDCVITLGTLGFVRDILKSAENTEAVNAINIAIKYTAWELSKRATG